MLSVPCAGPVTTMIVSGLPSTSESLRRMPQGAVALVELDLAGERGGSAFAVLLEAGGEAQHLAVGGVNGLGDGEVAGQRVGAAAVAGDVQPRHAGGLERPARGVGVDSPASGSTSLGAAKSRFHDWPPPE